MSTDDNKALMRRFFEEVYTKKNLDAIEEFIAPNHIDHSAAAASLPVGPEGSRVEDVFRVCTWRRIH